MVPTCPAMEADGHGDVHKTQSGVIVEVERQELEDGLEKGGAVDSLMESAMNLVCDQLRANLLVTDDILKEIEDILKSVPSTPATVQRSVRPSSIEDSHSSTSAPPSSLVHRRKVVAKRRVAARSPVKQSSRKSKAEGVLDGLDPLGGESLDFVNSILNERQNATEDLAKSGQELLDCLDQQNQQFIFVPNPHFKPRNVDMSAARLVFDTFEQSDFHDDIDNDVLGSPPSACRSGGSSEVGSSSDCYTNCPSTPTYSHSGSDPSLSGRSSVMQRVHHDFTSKNSKALENSGLNLKKAQRGPFVRRSYQRTNETTTPLDNSMFDINQFLDDDSPLTAEQQAVDLSFLTELSTESLR